MIRRAIRTTMEVLGTASGLTALARRRAGDSIAILAYHNVVNDADAGRGDSSLHLPLRRFIQQIDRLARTHDIVDIDDIRLAPTSTRPRAVITFDDAYHGAVTLAVPELIRRGLPAVVFVAPGLLGTAATWWDEVAEMQLLSDTARDDLLESLAGRGDAIRERVFAKGSVSALPRSYRVATLDELRQHCGDNIRIGSHTWGHEYLPALSSVELDHSLRRTLKWLDGYAGPTSRWLALPYGGGSADLGRRALELGHCGVLRITGGLWTAETNRAQVPRINVPAGVSLNGLELRTSGLKGG